MSAPAISPVLLLILDGCGLAPDGPGNAIALAHTPVLDALVKDAPCAALACSGRAVGLPAGFMGNSEVGHMNLGAGRVVYQDMTRIDIAIEDGSFFTNPVILALMADIKAAGGRLHCMGLLSDGGVHSHSSHLKALLTLAKQQGVPALVHVFLDGRDQPPTSGHGDMLRLQTFLQELGWGEIVTVTGRYWAMDRDKRWDRVERFHRALTLPVSLSGAVAAADPAALVQAAYDAGETDEFVAPHVITGADGQAAGQLRDGDGIFFFNFRADRARQLCRALWDDAFDAYPRPMRPRLAGFATMTRYDASLPLPAAFPPQDLAGVLGEVVASHGLQQLRIAETEKYAHVTYFFSGGREALFDGEERALVPSPREVATYDLKPEMSCPEVTRQLLAALAARKHALIVCNLANMDMVGHTGSIPAAMQAVETVDTCVGQILDAARAHGWRTLLTADHGNAEEMLDAQGNPQTAHSTNPVPLVLILPPGDPLGNGAAPRLADGRLGDVAPTVLALMGLDNAAPGSQMTGESLLRPTSQH
ncbi:2,3-bisphosphoglycerate-independent phosphoglycerate mutase [Megalodesulfovibrio gigas]|uniref:2,3-bisphosphoglycerate-independent phosphoglycerate mutase n=1 Tax=Megalodesulfovibrio gigas (strain ATCC 19364 / DSM 1382 / NCIMB 9332 / VKM B-1759) TaxID=1121448 RepID=T2GGH0_MEGG1|nr:2,3-bisphosphoglycerate-independent phosphoglycerate mutase [Megalodesulfovibrio gigas]AGW15167.1 putative 2,3-bisphosphoglycerate-independent phosphoglycerate mutase [Megalodesulfovibrio gigas DSM 1382 = ATCC 19364]